MPLWYLYTVDVHPYTNNWPGTHGAIFGVVYSPDRHASRSEMLLFPAGYWPA